MISHSCGYYLIRFTCRIVANCKDLRASSFALGIENRGLPIIGKDVVLTASKLTPLLPSVAKIIRTLQPIAKTQDHYSLLTDLTKLSQAHSSHVWPTSETWPKRDPPGPHLTSSHVLPTSKTWPKRDQPIPLPKLTQRNLEQARSRLNILKISRSHQRDLLLSHTKVTFEPRFQRGPNTFYDGLTSTSRILIDSSAGGSLQTKTIAEALALIELIAKNQYMNTSERDTLKKCVMEVETVNALMTQLSTMNKKLEKLEAAAVGTQNSCGLCGGPHENHNYSLLQDDQSAATQVNYVENEENRAKRLNKLAEEIEEQKWSHRVTFWPRSKREPNVTHPWTSSSSLNHHKPRLDHVSTWAKRGPSKFPKLSLTLSKSRLDHASMWAKRDSTEP
ncbi:hypothetical protein PIB30_094421 [Stylosanthes scabra]|uniref:Uncharacterized protein n=1 Tax=Stylosanthes scabra TaxID=79078 RepID=A0ABU6QVD7_9FABA|nr:hypothetical protein [Stylosanthes scabra]